MRPALAAALSGLLLLASGCTDGPEPAPGSPAPVVVSGPAKVPEGWTTPVKLGFNDEGWEDSPYLSRDGKTLYFFYHPGPDLITKLDEAMKIQFDGRIYTSAHPFTTKKLHPVSTPDMASEAGPYVSLSGDFYYHGNKRTIELQRVVPESIYRNGERLDLGTGGDEANPHYCDAMDELWFDCPADQHICVLKNASAGNFTGKAQRATNRKGWASSTGRSPRSSSPIRTGSASSP